MYICIVTQREKTIAAKFLYLIGTTKGEIFSRCKNWQSARTTIRRHAVKIYESSDKPKACNKCGYNKHYEICHIKAVSDFVDETLVEEINSINNLIALCPNCHWEFDNLDCGVDVTVTQDSHKVLIEGSIPFPATTK